VGPNYPVVYDPDPRYRVKTPRDANKERSDNLIAKGTNVSYLTPNSFAVNCVQVEPSNAVTKAMCVENTHGWKPNGGEWKRPYNLPDSYMVPAKTEAEFFQTSKEDRLYGTMKGEMPESSSLRR
jgi:hypothetical protein